jgi:capsular polysaccharide export protein
MEQIAILTSGLWRLRDEVAALTGMEPIRWGVLRRPDFAAVAGWGHKPTADRARRLAQKSGAPYIAFEDGPLRSVRPGPAEPPLSMVVDRSGIYYESAKPSDLFDAVADRARFTPSLMERARQGFEQLKVLRLSKYNSGPERLPAELGLSARPARRVLVLDQVRDDASIAGALADASSFQKMLAAALADNPDAEIVIKLHPDVLSGRRAGYFSQLVPSARQKLVAEPVNPWSLLDAVDSVYTVSSGLGFEAALAGKRVVTFGSSFYSGWGFSDDRSPKVERPARIEPLELFAAYYLLYTRYLDPYTRREISFEEAAEELAWLRDRFMENASRAICYRITRWKRGTVDRMLDGPAGPPLHVADPDKAVALAQRHRGQVVAWSSRDTSRLEEACRRAAIPLVRVEDGFIRSAGLGASFVRPLSLVFDRRGIYYNSGRPSDLEARLQEGEFPPALLERAAKLREKLVAAGTTKYNVAATGGLDIDSGGRKILLVPGQVEDDASIQRGSPRLKRNIDLLAAVRERHPGGYVVYKPHPDVEAGFRRGRVPQELAQEYADRIVTNASILSLIAVADRVETMTSLAGFEALLRGKQVATHGQPFYAGWGLTEDFCPLPRRTRRRSLDELVAAALILYPRYLDPVSGLPCTPELLVERLAAAGQLRRTPAQALLRVAQIAAARALHLGHSAKHLARRAASPGG